MNETSRPEPDDTPSEPQAPDSAAVSTSVERRAHKRYWRRRLIWRALMLLMLAPLAALFVAALLMFGREVSAPSWVVASVETRAQEVLGGGRLEFGEMTLTLGEDLHPRLVLRNSTLRDKDNIVLARVPRIEGQVSPRGVLQGRILAQKIRLSGAQLQLRRGADGAFAIAFDSGAGDVRTAESFVALLDQLDSMFESGVLEALEQVSADGLIINYADARAGRSWIVDSGQLDLDLRGGETVIRANIALLSGRDYVTNAEMTYRSPRGSSAAELGVVIEDAAAPDIASQSPLLSWLGVLEAPISGAMRGELDEDGLLRTVSATLQIGAGRLQPNAETRPIPFDGARTYLSFSPVDQKLSFDLIEIDSDWGRVSGSGQAYLREFVDGWPAAILGQVEIEEMEINPADLFPEQRMVGAALADFRLRLDPFTLDVGELVLLNEGDPLRVSGAVTAETSGWYVALDGRAEQLSAARLLALWPEALKPRTRTWFDQNFLAGDLRDIAVRFRAHPNEKPDFSITSEFAQAQVRFMRDQPPITGAAGTFSSVSKRLVVELFDGHVVAPEGGQLDLAGSVMTVPEVGPNAPAHFDLAIDGTVTAAMSVLASPPFNVLAKSNLPVTLADGRAAIDVSLDVLLMKDAPADSRVWSAEAVLSNLRSDVLVPGRRVTASRIALTATQDSLVLQGPAQVDGVRADVVFSRALGDGSDGTARLEADLTLNQTFLSAFNIGLAAGMLSGEGRGAIKLDLTNSDAPEFRLTSNLRGIGLSLPAIGWAKGRNSSGELLVTGVLGAVPRIDRLRLSAAGLEADGQIQLADGGGLRRAGFERVRIGNWLDAPVVLEGRGAGRPLGISIAGGTLDLRRADFGTGGGAGGGGPLSIALDRLQVTEGIALTDFRGEFTAQGGFSGEFTARVNGGAAVQGTVVPINGRSGVRIQSTDAGGVFRSANLLENATGGNMDLTLRPTGAEGSYLGTLAASDLRVRDAPALASLLDAISVVGLLTQLDGQGLMFNEVRAEFRVTPTQIVVSQSSAIGPGLGVSLDGIYAIAPKTVDFQGVVSPFYLLNGIGSVLTRPGEGLIGFNFNLRGPVDSPRVLVNPLSALTPGMFREIFRRPPPTLNQ